MMRHARHALNLSSVSGWIARNPYKPAIRIGTIAAAVNSGLGLLLIGVLAAPLLAVPAGALSGWSVSKHPRFAARAARAGAVAGSLSGLVLALGSGISGAVAATIGSLIPSSTPSSSSSSLQAWSLDLYVTFIVCGLALGMLAFFECVITATIVGAARGWRNRPLPTFPVIYE